MEAKTLTLVERLKREADLAAQVEQSTVYGSPSSLREAITALEAAQKALEPFAKHARLLEEARQDGFVAHAGPMDADDLRLARSTYDMLIGEDKTKGEEG